MAVLFVSEGPSVGEITEFVSAFSSVEDYTFSAGLHLAPICPFQPHLKHLGCLPSI